MNQVLQNIRSVQTEVFVDGKVVRLDNFRRLDDWGSSKLSKQSLWRQEKGRSACVGLVLSAIRGAGDSLIDFHEIVDVGRTSIELGNESR